MKFDGDLIEGPVIDKGQQASILLCHEEQAGSGWVNGGMDVCLLEGLFHILLCGPVWEADRKALKDVAIGPGQDGIMFHERPKMT